MAYYWKATSSDKILQIYLRKALRAINNYILKIEIKGTSIWKKEEKKKITQAFVRSFLCKFLFENPTTGRTTRCIIEDIPSSSLHQLN